MIFVNLVFIFGCLYKGICKILNLKEDLILWFLDLECNIVN